MADVWDIAEQGLARPSPTPSGDPWDIAERALAQPSGTPEYKGFQFSPKSGTQTDVAEGSEVAAPAVNALGDMPYVRGLVGELMQQIPTSAGQAGETVTGMLGNPYASVIDDLRQEPQKIAGVYRGLEEGKPLAQAVEDVLGKPKTYPEFNAEDWGRFTGQLGVAGAQALPFIGGLGEILPGRTSHIVEPPQMPQLPPSRSMGPGTLARDVSNALEWTPQSPPITPLEQTVANVQPPGPYVSPETGFTHYPGLGEGHAPVPSDWAYPPPGTDLKPIALRGPGGSTPALNAVAQAPPPPVAAATEPYTQEAAAARAAQPQPVTSGNVEGFAQTYGAGEIPAGPTLSDTEAWENAKARSETGVAKPYDFVARAQSGAITPEEMGDLIYEHHALVEKAAGLEGTSGYAEALAASKNFASNVLKPAENAWHRSGMTMQIKRPVNYGSLTAIDAAAERMGNELKANEVSQAKRVARENANAENGVVAAGNRALEAMDKEYSRGARRGPPKTKEQLRNELAGVDPCVL